MVSQRTVHNASVRADPARSTERTWVVLQRDLSVWLRDVNEPTATTMVVDAAGGGTPVINGGATVYDSLRATLLLAANGSGSVKGQLPDRIQATTAIADELRSVLGQLQRDAGFPSQCTVEEVTTADYAEWVFDGFIAQVAGRPQPEELLQPEEVTFLYVQARLFVQAEPWTNLAADELFVDLKLGSQRMEGVLTIMGDRTKKPGLLLIPGRKPATPLVDSFGGMPRGTIFTMLEGADGPPDLFLRARRYGWPADAVVTPSFLSIGDKGVRELDRRESYPMALALAGMAAYSRGGGLVDASGNLDLPNGRHGRFHIRKALEPPEATRPGYTLVSVKWSDDLMPRDSDVQIGIISREQLDDLRRHADVVVRSKIPYPAGISSIPFIGITPSNRDDAGVVDRIKGANPIGATFIERGSELMLAIMGLERGFVTPTDRSLAKAWRRDIQQSDGAHVLIVTDSLVNKEAPDPDRPRVGQVGRVYGLFECMLPGGVIEAAKR
jgi:hypothetical protein